MIVVAIIGILAAIALPAYQSYTDRARFSEVINATQSVKSAVEVCYQTGNALNDCDTAGNNGVSVAAGGSTIGEFVNTVTVVDGLITATSVNIDATNPDYRLQGSDAGNVGAVRWDVASASTCIALGLCAN